MRTRLGLTLIAAMALVGTAACDSGGGGGGGTGTKICNVEPTLTSIADHYFKPSCSFGAACHANPSARGELDLSPADIHARLVGAAPANTNANAAGKLLVIAGDANASFLLQKVDGTHGADEGKLMPLGARGPVDPDCGPARLREWITAGAADD